MLLRHQRKAAPFALHQPCRFEIAQIGIGIVIERACRVSVQHGGGFALLSVELAFVGGCKPPRPQRQHLSNDVGQLFVAAGELHNNRHFNKVETTFPGLLLQLKHDGQRMP